MLHPSACRKISIKSKMTATSHPEFNSQTEALDVAKAFSEAIRGKTVLVTGVNRQGIGFATSEAFVSTT